MNGIDISEYSGNSAVNGNIAINNTVAGIVVGKYSGNSTVNGNIAINNLAHGIALGQNSGNSTVNGNIATNNSRTGIALSSSNCTLTGNNVSNNSEYGIRLWHAGGNIVTGNNVTFNSMNGIYLMYSADCNVTANTVVNNPNYGINIYWSPDCSVIGNIVSNNSDDGIYIHAKSHNCILTGNVVTNNSGEGIYIYDDISNCTVTGNNITNNAYNGIYLEITSNCTLIGNNISNNLNYGIHTYSSWNCTLIGNNVSKNSGYGIFLGMFSSNCTVTGNWLIKNLGANFRNSGTNNLVYDNILINFLGVSFTASKSSILIGDIVSFTDTSTNGNPPLSYEWEFGDGTTSTLQNPSHSYSVAGIYAVSLNVTDSDGDFAIYNMDITVNEDLLPDASFTVLSTTVIVDNVVSFTDTSTEGNPPLSYEWEFGDGTTSTLQNPTHSYSVVGIYTVLLNVTDSDGDFAIYNMDITVIEDLQPSASFTVLHSTVYVSDIVSFTDASTGGNSPLSYTWIFGDGTTSTLQNPTHSYSAAGIYSVSLNVTDINGDSAISSTSITVIQDIQPSASFTVLHSTVYVDDVVSFTDTSTGGNSPLSYTWDFGDGTTSILQNPTHSYSSAGIYYVSLTVTDSDGDSHSSNLDMVVISTNDSTIPSYSIGILLFSVGVTVIIILKRKSIKS
jgi:parallel beta-helix repeat protein